MKKMSAKALLIALPLILMVAPQVSAMEIVVDRQGTVHFYESRVLGDDDRQDEAENETEDQDDDQDDDQDEVEDEKGADENEADDNDDDRTEIKTEIRTIAPYQRKQFEFKREDDGRYKIEIQDGKNKLKLRGTGANEPELVEADSVDLSLPVRSGDQKRKELQLEQLKKRLEERQEVKSLSAEDREKLIKDKQEELAKYQQKIAAERKKKQAEQIRLKSVDNNGGGFELEANAARAKLTGANFNYDQESGEVAITTPSGQEHTLTHLPDEAVAQMAAHGFFIDSGDEVAIDTSGEDVQYKVASKKNKKLFGMINRQVDAEVILDDLTGDVTEQEVEPTNFWTRLLNRFSY